MRRGALSLSIRLGPEPRKSSGPRPRPADFARRAEAERLLDEGYRVLAADLLFCGECRAAASPKPQQYVLALLLSSLSDRPLGIQAGQLLALAQWAETQFGQPAQVVAVGRRTCLCALVAASVAERIAGVELHDPLGSLKELIERNGSYREDAEIFCFGLLELLDVKQLVALVAPRPVVVCRAGARARAELAGLKAWYALLGADFDPLAAVAAPKKNGKVSDGER
jgi:hypothetical protein